mmetsp:Transcript_92646/g.266424  ORF Transcript_92646/g.266424 Transcript_92646/m.266424 type:complete len:214 (+) Transcript_92646:248-889(+)
MACIRARGEGRRGGEQALAAASPGAVPSVNQGEPVRGLFGIGPGRLCARERENLVGENCHQQVIELARADVNEGDEEATLDGEVHQTIAEQLLARSAPVRECDEPDHSVPEEGEHQADGEPDADVARGEVGTRSSAEVDDPPDHVVGHPQPHDIGHEDQEPTEPKVADEVRPPTDRDVDIRHNDRARDFCDRAVQREAAAARHDHRYVDAPLQ